MKTWSVKPMFFALCHSHCRAQWNTMMEHMLAKFHHGSVLSVLLQKSERPICLKDNLPFIYVAGWWDERRQPWSPTRLKMPGVLLWARPISQMLNQGIRIGLSKVTCVKLHLRWMTAPVKAQNIKLLKNTKKSSSRPQPGKRQRFLKRGHRRQP